MQEAQRCVIALDVGGTTIAYSAIDDDLVMVEPPRSISSQESAPKEEIIGHFNAIIDEMAATAREHSLAVRACSIAFPNPFEYEQGVALLKHKFRALYGLNLKQILSQHRDFPILFLNDADAFGYGVLNKQFAEPPASLACITLGTGVGVSFFDHGKLVDLEIWDTPYKGKILEDYVSARAITGKYKDLTGEDATAQAIAGKAVQSEEAALGTFKVFATDLGEGLAAAVGHLHPDTIVLGGAISQSFALFGGVARETYHQKTGSNTAFVAATDPNLSLYGAAAFAAL